MNVDLFGEVPKPISKAKTGPKAKGYAYHPGSGPKGETCKTCKHCFKKTFIARPVYKCLLTKAAWGATKRTDILVKSPACKFWEKAQ